MRPHLGPVAAGAARRHLTRLAVAQRVAAVAGAAFVIAVGVATWAAPNCAAALPRSVALFVGPAAMPVLRRLAARHPRQTMRAAGFTAIGVLFAVSLAMLAPGIVDVGVAAAAIAIALPLSTCGWLATSGTSRHRGGRFIHARRNLTIISLLVGSSALLASVEWSALLGLATGILVAGWAALASDRDADGDLTRKLSAALWIAAGALVVVYGRVAFGTGLPAGWDQYVPASVLERQVLWRDTLALTRDYWFTGSGLGNTASVDRRNAAIARLQASARAASRALAVSVTLPVLPTGLTAEGRALVASALARGVVLDAVNIMAMDYGDGAAPNPSGQMGTYATQAATSTKNQLKTIYANAGRTLTDGEAWRLVGITPMIGVNDVTSEVFSPSDAQVVLDFARSVDLRLLSFWSANRDQPAPAGSGGVVSGAHCGLTTTTSYQFSGIFLGY